MVSGQTKESGDKQLERIMGHLNTWIKNLAGDNSELPIEDDMTLMVVKVVNNS